jgi:hypothetical protein
MKPTFRRSRPKFCQAGRTISSRPAAPDTDSMQNPSKDCNPPFPMVPRGQGVFTKVSKPLISKERANENALFRVNLKVFGTCLPDDGYPSRVQRVERNRAYALPRGSPYCPALPQAEQARSRGSRQRPPAKRTKTRGAQGEERTRIRQAGSAWAFGDSAAIGREQGQFAPAPRRCKPAISGAVKGSGPR